MADNYMGEMAKIEPDHRVKLDVKDIKILNVLSENGRYPYSTIAKKVKISRELVAYRIKRLIDKKVINGFIALVNTNAMGYLKYDIYMKLQKTGADKEKEILRKLKRNNKVTWLATLGGNYDISVGTKAKTVSEFDKNLTEILNVCGDCVSSYTIVNVLHENSLPWNLFGKRVETSVHRGKSDGSFKKELEQAKKDIPLKIDEKDKNILRILASNGRSSMIEIGKKLKLTPNAVNYRIKKLIEHDLISNFTLIPSYQLLGLEWNYVLIKFKNFTASTERKFLQFIKEHPYIDYFNKSVGNWNYQIAVLSKNSAHLRTLLMELRDAFQESLQEYESVRLFRQHKFSKHIGDDE